MSSSDLETGIAQQVAQKKKEKKTKKKFEQPPAVAPATPDADPAKNEGDDPHWAYEPPEGAVLLDHRVDVGAFEWKTVKDDEDTEIWLIRAPDSIKAKHLQGLEIDPSSSSRTAHIGTLARKTASYDVWCIGDDKDEDVDVDADVAGGEELRGLACLLPRKRKKGKLYIAPKRVSRHIVVSARPPVATPPEHQHQNPQRASYPKDMLKHAFVPYGARSKQTPSEDVSMDVDDVDATQDQPVRLPKGRDKPAKTKESKGKKRKGEGGSPKISKKHKSNT